MNAEDHSVAQPGSTALPETTNIRGALRQIPFRASAAIRLEDFKLRDLRSLVAGQVLATGTSATDDVPVLVGGAPFAYAELDNVDGQMAVRLTRLS